MDKSVDRLAAAFPGLRPFLNSVSIFTLNLALILSMVGCGYQYSQGRVVSNEHGTRIRYGSRCMGTDCGGASYGQQGMWLGSNSPYPYSSAEGRLGLIEVYRARNHWVRSNSPNPGNTDSNLEGNSARDSRIDRLVPYVRHMANAMCNNGILNGEDCAPPERSANERNGQ